MRIIQVFFVLWLMVSSIVLAHVPCTVRVTCLECSDCDTTSLFSCGDNLYGKTFYSFRPQDSDSARQIVKQFYRYISKKEENTKPFEVSKEYAELFPSSANRIVENYNNLQGSKHNALTVTAQYSRSFSPNGLARWFFFNGTECMTVGIPDDEQTFDIDGSQIGLSLGNMITTTLQTGPIGTLHAEPAIENILIEFDYYHDLESIKPGLWIDSLITLVHMTTDFNLVADNDASTQKDDFPAGLFTIDGAGDPTCQTTPVPFDSILDALEGCKGWGSMARLSCSKFSRKKLHKFGVAGLHADLGYDFRKKETSYCAASFHVVVPTGSRPEGTYLFEPVIGANKSWQVGATLRGHHLIGQADKKLGLYGYLVMTHLFKAKQTRVFALKNNGPGSQLLLLKKFNATGTALEEGQRVANILCGTTKIGAACMLDGSFLAQFNYRKFYIDIGYNFWLRTREKRSKMICFKGFYENQLGIKGHLPLMSEQTIGCPGTSAVCSYDLQTASQSTLQQPADADSCTTYLSAEDIDFGAGLHPMTWSNKIFGACALKTEKVIAILSGSVEFGKQNSAVDQWSIALSLGKEF